VASTCNEPLTLERRKGIDAVKRAVIVGAGGIAVATGAELATRDFHDFHVLSRGQSGGGEEIQRHVAVAGGTASCWLCDLTDWASIRSACDNVPGPIDAVVYTAGARFTALPSELTQEGWHAAMDVYAGGLVGVLVSLESKLAEGATVVAISGTSARRVVSSGHLAMGAAKAAMERSIAYLAAWLGPRGVRVNGVCCGPVDTPSVRDLMTAEQMDRLATDLAASTLAGRLATSSDVAAAVAMLCGDDSRWIYGQVILADGGEELLRG